MSRGLAGLLFLGLGLIAARANAACSSPTAGAGAIEYFTGSSQYKLCDGTNWNVLDLGSTTFGACSKDKSVKFDPVQKAHKICTVGSYKKLNCVTGAGVDDSVCPSVVQEKLVPTDLTGQFGLKIKVSGDTAVIAQPYNGNGAAYVFVRKVSTWTLQQKLTPSSFSGSGATFGTGLAIEGDTILVGAPMWDGACCVNSSQGAVWVYTRSGTTWTERVRLTASDGAGNDYFGTAIALKNGTALIGATGKKAASVQVGGIYVYTGSGATWTYQTTIMASDGQYADNFGSTIFYDGNQAIIGTAANVSGKVQQGAVYVYTGSGASWTFQAKLTASDGVAADMMDTIDYSNGTIVAAAAGAKVGTQTYQGAVYVFTGSGSSWTQQAKLTASDGVGSDYFGRSVAISGDTIVVGAYGSSSFKGAVYVFNRVGTTWTQTTKLTAAEGLASDKLGASVAITNDSIMAGANDRPVDGANNAGAVYVFPLVKFNSKLTDPESNSPYGTGTAIDGNTALVASYGSGVQVYERASGIWSYKTKIPPPGGTGSYFGRRVAISGDTLITSDWAHDNASITQRGEAYIYVRSGNTWTLQATLYGQNALAFDHCGYSVAIEGDTAAIGCEGFTTGPGQVYVFTRSGTTWSLQQKLLASDAANNDGFGRSVSLSGDTIAVGDGFKTVATNGQQGAAYVFTRSAGVWTEQQKLVASDGAASRYFATMVALSGDILVASEAPTASVVPYLYGFQRFGSTWVQQAKFTGSASAVPSGWSQIDLKGDRLVAGNVSEQKVYLFSHSGSGWAQTMLMTPPSAMSFGYPALSGNDLVIGVSGTPGTVWFYTVSAPKSCYQPQPIDKGSAGIKTATSPWLPSSNVGLATGDTLFVCVTSLTDAVSGVTWNGTSLTADSSASSASAKAWLYVLNNATAGVGNVSVTFTSPTASAKAAAVLAVPGLATSSALDRQVSATGSGTTPSSGATAATTQALDFVISCIGSNGPVDSDSVGSWSNQFLASTRTGTTGGGPTTNIIATVGYKNTKSTGAQTGSITPLGNRAWAATVAAYKQIVLSSSSQICSGYGPCSVAGQLDYSSGNGMRWCDGGTWRQIKTTP